MGHLAVASDVPAIFVVQRVTDLALYYPSRVVAVDWLEAERAAMFFVHRQADCRMTVAQTA